MTPFETYMLPGSVAIRFICHIFNLSFEYNEPLLFEIFAFFVSWIIWVALIKAAWNVTMHLFGFAPRGR